MLDEGTAFYPQSTAVMNDPDMVRAMEFCGPKLGRIRSRLHDLVTVKKEKVILWAHWPLSQRLIQQVSSI